MVVCPSATRDAVLIGGAARRYIPRQQEAPSILLIPAGNQSGRPDLNRGPHRPERCALPGCATPRCRRQYHTRRQPRPAIVRADAWRALTDILAELDRLLEPGRFEDYCPNGLQVPGREEVATSQPACARSLELFERAAAERADLVLVHHGAFWDAEPRALDAAPKRAAEGAASTPT